MQCGVAARDQYKVWAAIGNMLSLGIVVWRRYEARARARPRGIVADTETDARPHAPQTRTAKVQGGYEVYSNDTLLWQLCNTGSMM